MKKTLSESILANLKESTLIKLNEWDSSNILDAAFQAAEVYGEDPDWSDVIDMIVDKISPKNFKKYLKDMGMTEDEFYDGLYEADPDSVISGLERYLSKKDIKDICSNFELKI